MKLNYITIMVRDIKKSLAFYQELADLKAVNSISLEDGEIVFLANVKGETMIELIEFKDAEKVSTKGMVMSFLVENDFEKLREKALSLGYTPSEIIDIGQKPKHFTVEDPDGIVVEFSI
ncbi:MAG: VOC family protein [Peptostreptococcus sp.]|uniref:VOC family protein n=1 Tax=Peptostreptococcus sp. TaxID=1262 RepID=UPI002FC70B82